MEKKATAARTAPVGSMQSWRELAVARSLDSARTRAESRVQRFLDAALELMADGDDGEFTVQEVVERSGQSLRSFYQYFGGKHELLLALFEESVRSTADHLGAFVDKEDGEIDRLHCFVIEYYRMCRPTPRGEKVVQPTGPVMIAFAQQLLTAHPQDAARVFVPLVSLFQQLLDDAVAAGSLRPEINRSALAGTVLEVIMFNAFSSTIGGSPLRGDSSNAAEDLWDLILNGIGSRAGA